MLKMKSELRKKILEKRRGLSQKESGERSEKIIEKLKETKEFEEANTILFYVSTDNEVCTHDLIRECLQNGKTIAVPYVANEEIMISKINSFKDLRKGAYGVLEPTWIIPILRSDLDLAVVPGIAFDKKKNRVGYGLGYYDIFLKGLKCPKIGLAFDFQIVDKIDTEKHDVKLDKVLTD